MSAQTAGKHVAEVPEDEIDKISEQIREAAEFEGVAPMPEDLIPLREEMVALKIEMANLEQRKKEIQDAFGKRIEDAGLVGFVVDGKVHARLTRGTRHAIDTKRLKEKLPHVYKEYLKVTAYRSVRVD